ncbi:MAG: histidine--tRNA ligase [Thalassospira sp.]|uniref:histidine--tRNA ligase n=1 Tax=Thalassospira sp. TaxID=1912094 RepID=UPI003A89A302
MASLQPVRGTHDLLPDQNRLQDYIANTAREIGELYGYHRMTTPIFEFTDVFARTLGDTSDVVTKEMYTFEDRGGEQITLRPEGTAGIARAYVSNGMQQMSPVKVSYYGPMFRYERPQKGRQRQFHQIGAELLGVEQVAGDIEIIGYGAHILKALGLWDSITLELNTLGDPESRAAYRDVLVDYFKGHFDKLSEDSRNRLEKNPLRILDSKDDGDRELVANAPLFAEYLNEHSKEFFKNLTEGLGDIGINYELNPRLVRGLDYYCHTCFEFTTNTLGAQGTVMAGGRYDGLISTMGGPQTAGVGWAAGVERLALMVGEAPAGARPVALIPMGEAAEAKCRTLAQTLREAGIAVELGYSGNMKKRMKRADKANAKMAVILGDDELAKGVAQLRDLDSGEQQEVALEQLADVIGKK